MSEISSAEIFRKLMYNGGKIEENTMGALILKLLFDPLSVGRGTVEKSPMSGRIQPSCWIVGFVVPLIWW